CQGALAITSRVDDEQTRLILAKLENADARAEIEAERAFLRALDGSCRTPIGALARKTGTSLTFIGETLKPDGTARWRRTATITLGADAISDAEALGEKLGREIAAEAGNSIIADNG